jgi:hypothetical protein
MFAKTHRVLKQYSIQIPDGFLEPLKNPHGIERSYFGREASRMVSRGKNQEAMTKAPQSEVKKDGAAVVGRIHLGGGCRGAAGCRAGKAGEALYLPGDISALF